MLNLPLHTVITEVERTEKGTGKLSSPVLSTEQQLSEFCTV